MNDWTIGQWREWVAENRDSYTLGDAFYCLDNPCLCAKLGGGSSKEELAKAVYRSLEEDRIRVSNEFIEYFNEVNK